MLYLNLPANWRDQEHPYEQLMDFAAGAAYVILAAKFTDEPEAVMVLPVVEPALVPPDTIDEFGLPTGEPVIQPLAEIFADGSAWITLPDGMEIVVRNWIDWCWAENRDPQRPWKMLPLH